MEGKNNIVAPIFKAKNSGVNKDEFIPRPAAKLQVNNIELAIFKGSNPKSSSQALDKKNEV